MSGDPRNDGQRVLSTRSYLSQNMEKFLQRFNSKRFLSSKTLIMVVAQLSEYSVDDLKAFGDFLKEDDRLPIEGVNLEQTFPVIADWLVQSKNRPQSSKLS